MKRVSQRGMKIRTTDYDYGYITEWLDSKGAEGDYPVSFETTRYESGQTGGQFITDATGHLLATPAAAFVAERGVSLTPAVSTDIDGQARPQGGTQPDIGADEVAFVPVELSSFTME